MKTLRVILFPGVPQTIEVDENTTVKEAFDKAGFDISNRELKLDGRMVSENDRVGNANMAIAMRKIKGNNELSEGMDVVEREKGLAQNVNEFFPTHAKIADIDGDNYQITLITDEDDYITMDFEEFYAIYDVKDVTEAPERVEEVVEVEQTVERPSEPAQEVVDKTPALPVEEHHCECDCVKSNTKTMLKYTLENRERQINLLRDLDKEVEILEKVLGLR